MVSDPRQQDPRTPPASERRRLPVAMLVFIVSFLLVIAATLWLLSRVAAGESDEDPIAPVSLAPRSHRDADRARLLLPASAAGPLRSDRGAPRNSASGHHA